MGSERGNKDRLMHGDNRLVQFKIARRTGFGARRQAFGPAAHLRGTRSSAAIVGTTLACFRLLMKTTDTNASQQRNSVTANGRRLRRPGMVGATGSASSRHPARCVRATPAVAGLLACGSPPPIAFPEASGSQWQCRRMLSAYSCGGSRGVVHDSCPHRVPF
jgi:hypothetical protein